MALFHVQPNKPSQDVFITFQPFSLWTLGRVFGLIFIFKIEILPAVWEIVWKLKLDSGRPLRRLWQLAAWLIWYSFSDPSQSFKFLIKDSDAGAKGSWSLIYLCWLWREAWFQRANLVINNNKKITYTTINCCYRKDVCLSLNLYIKIMPVVGWY